jgi:hypothetical protein
MILPFSYPSQKKRGASQTLHPATNPSVKPYTLKIGMFQAQSHFIVAGLDRT